MSVTKKQIQDAAKGKHDKGTYTTKSTADDVKKNLNERFNSGKSEEKK